MGKGSIIASGSYADEHYDSDIVFGISDFVVASLVDKFVADLKGLNVIRSVDII